MGFTGFYWVLLGSNEIDDVLTVPGIVFLGFKCLIYVLPGFTGFYWVLLGFTGFFFTFGGTLGFNFLEFLFFPIFFKGFTGVFFSFEATLGFGFVEAEWFALKSKNVTEFYWFLKDFSSYFIQVKLEVLPCFTVFFCYHVGHLRLDHVLSDLAMW